MEVEGSNPGASTERLKIEPLTPLPILNVESELDPFAHPFD